MGVGNAGVAYSLWRRIEDKRLELSWTKTQLSEAAGLPRSTFNDLERTTRPPQPRIVHAYADAVGLDRVEAERLAGLRPIDNGAGAGVSVREAIQRSDTLTPDNKRTLLSVLDALEAANRAAGPGT